MGIVKRYVLLTDEQLRDDGIPVPDIEAAYAGEMDPWEIAVLWQNCVTANIVPQMGDQATLRVAWLARCRLIHVPGLRIEGVLRKPQ